VKAAGRTIAHRSELGAVEVVTDDDGLGAAYDRVAAVCAREGDDVVVQQGSGDGEELLVAVVRDPEYGLSAIVRPGGVLAELLDEQVVLWHGWPARRRLAILRDSRVGRLLAGYRGRPAGDTAALADAIDTVFGALADRTVTFLELNPVVVAPGGIRAVDAMARQPL
jgi:acetyl-CoA synthetase